LPSREDLDRHPICSGAESCLAGAASCRIEVSDVDALFAELQSAGVLHDVSRAGVSATDFGTREFATLDSDGNLLCKAPAGAPGERADPITTRPWGSQP
jgi:hypothetical protein